MKYIKIYENKRKIKVDHKKYVLAKEINQIFKYSIYCISPYRLSKPYVDRQNNLKYDIEIKQVAFFDENGKEMKYITKDAPTQCADSYWIFNPNYNNLYFETDTLKNAKEMIKVLIDSKKYNL